MWHMHAYAQIIGPRHRIRRRHHQMSRHTLVTQRELTSHFRRLPVLARVHFMHSMFGTMYVITVPGIALHPFEWSNQWKCMQCGHNQLLGISISSVKLATVHLVFGTDHLVLGTVRSVGDRGTPDMRRV